MKLVNTNKVVQSREDFIAFIKALQEDLRKSPHEWENKNLDDFLGAIAGWVEDIDGYYSNQNEPVPSQPTWNMFADILSAARIYE